MRIAVLEVATVYATGAVRGFARFERHGDADTSAILLTMDDGMPVLVDGSRHDPLGYDVRMEIAGSQDVVVVGLDERTPLHRLGTHAAPAPAGPGRRSPSASRAPSRRRPPPS
jgi:myo-inositol 2-dehydrogenase/D-chiro-inositol 1-dehydrogenase